MENDTNNRTGLLCLQFLFGQVRRNVNFSSLITDNLLEEYQKTPVNVILMLAEKQQLSPEVYSSREMLDKYSGPMLMAINDENWIFIFNSSQLKDNNGTAVIIDPNLGNKALTVPVKQILERCSGQCIVFHNLAQINASKQTKISSFIQIARHYNVPVDIREVMHEYAVGEEEISDALFREVAEHYQFKIKKTDLTWDEFPSSRSVFPCVAIKNNGNYTVLCGIRYTSETEYEVVILDPESEQYNTTDRFSFYSKEQFEEQFSRKCILLKKIYRLSDEEQPFSLRWFIPEFIKNKGIFGQIALMVVMLTIFSLILSSPFVVDVNEPFAKTTPALPLVDNLYKICCNQAKLAFF